MEQLITDLGNELRRLRTLRKQSNGSEEGKKVIEKQCELIIARFRKALAKFPAKIAASNLEEQIWRNCYYKRIESYRQQVTKLSSKSTGQAQTHSFRAVKGAFCHFLDTSSAQYKALLSSLEDAHAAEKSATKKEWIKLAIYRCNLYLGDLARYRELQDDSKPRSWTTAEKFYRAALAANVSNGNPHNQLAVLADYRGKLFLSMYHYVLSLHSERPFETTHRNLDLLCARVHQQARKKGANDISSMSSNTLAMPLTSSQRNKVLNTFLFRYLYLHATLSLANDTEEVRTVCAPVIQCCEGELSMLLRKYALTKELQLGLIVLLVHNIMVSRDSKPLIVHSVAQEAAFSLVAVFVEVVVASSQHSAPTGRAGFNGDDADSIFQMSPSISTPANPARSDLLAPVAIFFHWLRNWASLDSSSPGAAIDFESASARRLWASVSNLWPLLLNLGLSYSERHNEKNETSLWEDQALSGFVLPGTVSLIPPERLAKTPDQNVSQDLEADNGAPSRAFTICRFFDWLVNVHGLCSVVPFEPPVMTDHDDDESNAVSNLNSAMSSAAAILEDSEHGELNVKQQEDLNVTEENLNMGEWLSGSAADEEVIVMAPLHEGLPSTEPHAEATLLDSSHPSGLVGASAFPSSLSETARLPPPSPLSEHQTSRLPSFEATETFFAPETFRSGLQGQQGFPGAFSSPNDVVPARGVDPARSFVPTQSTNSVGPSQPSSLESATLSTPGTAQKPVLVSPADFGPLMLKKLMTPPPGMWTAQQQQAQQTHQR
mmetsp:Transcript_7664/g.13434  ORF Transcript_7664/g.13434 Transcript_7664/m.13434 type:complete len:774 (+) Transcript_7664:312-2633(+)